MKNQSVPLSSTSSSNSLVKESALLFFKSIRVVASYVSELPEAATQAAKDVRDAWEESSRPNA